MKAARELRTTQRIPKRQRALALLMRFERTRLQAAHLAAEVMRLLSRLLGRLSRGIR